MRLSLRIIAILIVAILIVSSVYVVFFTESEETNKELKTDDKENEDNNEDDNGDKDEGDDNATIDQEFIHTVFIEEGTATWCEFCPNVAEVLDKLFNPDDPEFYYISLVENKNDLALDRVANHYNRFANPTVYIDGGFEVIYGFKEDTFETEFKQKVKNSLLRKVPDLILQINAEWNESRTELSTSVNIENKDPSTYSGELMVFICTQFLRSLEFLVSNSCRISRDEKGLERTNCVEIGDGIENCGLTPHASIFDTLPLREFGVILVALRTYLLQVIL